ncbi:MAG: proprotein convertase P-domain-containing protein, partial [Acidobacteriota bacterium]
MPLPTNTLPLRRRLVFFACLCAGCWAVVAAATPGRPAGSIELEGAEPNKDRAPSQPAPAILGGLTTFGDRPSFDAAFPGLPTEDFEQGAVADGASVACPAPLDAAGDGTCFAAGNLEAGVIYQDAPGPDGVDGLLLIGDGAFGNVSKILATNAFGDALELVFPEPLEALGLDLVNLPGPDDALSIDVFTPAGELLGSVSSPSSASGVFWGVSSPDPIGRVVLRSTINQVEAVDNLSFGVGQFLSLADVASVDTCATEAANENGVWEPNESVELSVTLQATGAAFTGITGTLSAADPAFVFITDEATWPDLADGDAAVNATSLRFVIAGDLCAELVDLTLDVTSDQGAFQIPLTDRVGFDQSPGVPLEVPDGSPFGAESTLEIDTDVAVSDLGVDVEIEHTWVGDLTISLESPGGTTVVLLDRPGVPDDALGCNNNNVSVTFSDAAAVDPESFCNASSSDPWIVGDVLPTQALAAFDGESSQGTWTLRVVDASAGDLGTLVNWRLEQPDPLGAECTACALSSDVAVAKTCEGFPSYLCQIDVTNLGVSPTFDLVVTDTIPAPLFWLGDDCGAGPPVGNVLTWNAPPVDVGGSV